MGVHPRVCGETSASIMVMLPWSGPSPRVRGNLPAGALIKAGDRSIPACAGKPTPCHDDRTPPGVHPRVCGETWSWKNVMTVARGPSPRVRGNPDRGAGVRQERGSIPACAGKPTGCPCRKGAARVHPRVCGETRVAADFVAHRLGPSPRVRGNRVAARPAPRRCGSIPACAGKPSSRCPGRWTFRVHPRVCGETTLRFRSLPVV